MELNSLWFILIGVLFTGFFILEGFDYGVGILAPFLAKNDDERRVMFNTVGPWWDGNEVWLLTAGGAMFAAFPNWYATLFGGFYLALFLMLLALIVRAVAFEFRSKSWFKKDILDLLRAKGCSLCVADTDEKPAGEIVRTAPWGYLRLRRADYTEADLAQWLERIRTQPWEEAFVFFKHEEEGKGPELARRFQELAAKGT